MSSSNIFRTTNGPDVTLAMSQVASPPTPVSATILHRPVQIEQTTKMAEPLHIQRLKAALDMRNFMDHAREMLSQPLSSGCEDDDFDADERRTHFDDDGQGSRLGSKRHNKLLGTKEERQNVKTHIYNFSDLGSDREWLYDVILSDTETETDLSDEDDYIREMLKEHIRTQKYRENFYKKATNTQYAYYGSGLLSQVDMFPEHQQSIVGVRKRKRRSKKDMAMKIPKILKSGKIRKPRTKILEQPEPGEIHPADLKHYAFGDTSVLDDDEDDLSDDQETGTEMNDGSIANVSAYSGRGRRRRSQIRTPEVMAARRRRVWQLMAKKELGRCQRGKVNNHKEVVQNCKRVGTMCMKVVRQRAMQSQKVMKETIWRAKRLTREMLSYWKRYERVERDTRRRMEREAEEQRKIDVEIIEAKRQQRKLNFLITQTELYAHFMSKKLGQGSEEEQLRILNQLDEEVNPRLAAYDDYNAENMKLLAQKNAEDAFDADRAKKQQFDVVARMKQEAIDANTVLDVKKELQGGVGGEAKADLPQPKIFNGTLKHYQIKGMTWLANLYDQGISGILADEMGLGKTVQSIAFLCHIAETYGVWGPFLIISPASTLHNWQQEMERFVPEFNVVPYWGSPNERKILRQFWEQKDLHTRDASFHVVITSYQLIVSDYKYFNRIKWQYMVLDEAQAIKSSSSMRWKLLLGFNCRNRLLLSGTPIQNSMAELWALLHFIMPTLFDSHDEFNEWFSKDIESHAENKTGIDEKQISRLHMILKPFMLRRIKKDVENELSDKIEIMVYCPLTIRQKLLYMALKNKIRIEDLLHLTGGGAGSSTGDGHHIDRNFTSNLMNLVMQFRKVCNHPELFERRDVKSPFAMRCETYVMPRLVFEEALLYRSIPSKRHLLYNKFSIFKADYIHHSLFGEEKKSDENYPRYVDLNLNKCCFSFTRLANLSLEDIEDVTIRGLIALFHHYLYKTALATLLAYRRQWWTDYRSPRYQLLEVSLENPLLKCGMFENSILRNFIFTGTTSNDSTVYAFGDYTIANMQETIEHRVIRSKNASSQVKSELIEELVEIKTEPDVVVDVGDECDLPSTPPIKSSTEHGKLKQKAEVNTKLLPEFPYRPRKPVKYSCEPLQMPRFLYGLGPRVQAVNRRSYCDNRSAEWAHIRHTQCENVDGLSLVTRGLSLCRPHYGWSPLIIPDKQTLVTDAGKLAVLDSLLTRLKAQGHRVLIYSQMTKMIDLLEEYMWHRKHRYMRLDGSSKISARRDMVADFQTRADIFVFLLSTRAGGLGINLTAADTVIFYDSDWNPTVDQQAMDRAHRLGQTKQVTVYRLICKGTIEERILQRAREKSEIQRMVISGGNFKPDTLKPKEVVSLLLDDEEIEMRYRQKIERSSDVATTTTKDATANEQKRRMQSSNLPSSSSGSNEDANVTVSHEMNNAKRIKLESSVGNGGGDDDSIDLSTMNSGTSSPSTTTMFNSSEPFVPGATTVLQNDDSDNETLIVDCENNLHGGESSNLFGDFGGIGRIRRRHHPRGTKRGRPRGSTRRGGGNGASARNVTTAANTTTTATSSGADNQQKNKSEQQQEPSAPLTNMGEGYFTPTIPQPIKRGPGRPRLKTSGPIHTGSRGGPRTRRPIGPLVVPIGKSPAATPLNRSPVISPAPSPAHSERSHNYSGGGAG